MITDERAAELIDRVMHLAITLRDEGPDAARAALAAIKDPWAALGVAAALLHVDEPVQAWWQDGLAGLHGGGCEDCHGPIVGRGPRAVVCESCRLARRRTTYRESSRAHRVSASREAGSEPLAGVA